MHPSPLKRAFDKNPAMGFAKGTAIVISAFVMEPDEFAALSRITLRFIRAGGLTTILWGYSWRT
jgi:hypothetical protein